MLSFRFKRTFFSLVFAGMLCCALFPSVSWAGKKAVGKASKNAKRSNRTPAWLWKGTDSFFRYHFLLVSDMMTEDGRGSFSRPKAQLRIQWNAASVLRLLRAYRHYTKGFEKHFPSKKAKWSALRGYIQILQKAAAAMRNDALSGTKGKKWSSLLIKLGKLKTTSVLGPQPKTISKSDRTFLFKVFSGMSEGSEFLGYFRTRQVENRCKALAQKGGLAAYQKEVRSFGKATRANASFFRKVYIQTKKSKWTQLYVYHTTLLARSNRLLEQVFLGKHLSKKGFDVKKVEKKKWAQFEKYMRSLYTSLKKIDPPTMKYIWRL